MAQPKTIQIGNRTVGDSQELFIMAECGVTCNYDMRITKQLIDVVSDVGADAIKFIFWFPDEIMSDRTIEYRYETVDGPRSENMYAMLNKLRFTLDQWREIKQYANSRDVIVFSTVNSPTGIVWAEELKLDAYKLSSWDYNYLPLWRRIAALKKPMLMDTGPVNSTEIARVLDVLKAAGNDQAVLVHCTHTDDYSHINMRSIPYMRETFQILIGYSSKDREYQTDILAVALGASVLEKRLTMSRSLPGHHHILSMEPAEFAEYVKAMRNMHAALGKPDLIPSAEDLAERKRWFRHLVARVPLAVGTVLQESHLEGKRPEAGVSPELLEFFIGKRVGRDLMENEAIRFEDV